ALVFWTRLHGVLSLELAGHFTGMELDADLLYASEAQSLAGPRGPGRPPTSRTPAPPRPAGRLFTRPPPCRRTGDIRCRVRWFTWTPSTARPVRPPLRPTAPPSR
ncbi:MAG: WHG domain-containing protein, partial [Kitasatospora sp.]|nr:WHG domain-containing protein [Kitasatospora sp.]